MALAWATANLNPLCGKRGRGNGFFGARGPIAKFDSFTQNFFFAGTIPISGLTGKA